MSDDNSARLALPYLAAGQMQKHVTLNQALTRLDALVQAAAVSRTTAAQPAAPDDGDLYILPEYAEGAAWDGRPAGALMRFEAGGWTTVPVSDGMVAVVLDAGELVVRHEGDWRPLGGLLGEVQQLTRLGLGATADADNPFAAKLNKALWTALETGSGGDGDLRLTFNKQGAGDVLSLLFQSGYGGRAELGLIGDDDLRLKVSDDGSTWHEALSVDRATGRMTTTLGALRSEDTVLTADGSWTAPVWARRVEVLCVGGGGAGGQFGAAGTDRFGGGGGGAGGVSLAVWPAAALTGALTVTVGAGGLGGGSNTVGQSGEASSLSMGGVALLTGAGGQGGSPTGTGGAGGIGAPVSNGGGASLLVATGQTGGAASHPFASGGGGGGGGLDSSNTTRHGGPGGEGGLLAVASGGGTGGGSAGGDGDAAAAPDLGWTGGGGGGGGASVAGTGHAGGDGGEHGAGGGGGGAGLTAGGAGGDGAGGLVILRAVG